MGYDIKHTKLEYERKLHSFCPELYVCLPYQRYRLVSLCDFFCSFVVSGQQLSIYNVSCVFTSTFLYFFFPVALRFC
jgi:hypothetical protein